MKRVLLAGASALALTWSARAADMPVKALPPAPVPALSWTGWYAGLQGGFVSHRGEYNDRDGFLFEQFANAPPRNYDLDEVGGMFGAHAGYNWQAGALVFGLEADINKLWARPKERPADELGRAASITLDASWIATIRARLGFTIAPATMVYATGGVAFTDLENVGIQAGTVKARLSVKRDETAWVIGGGIEHMFAQNWTARAEVRYADFGSHAAKCGPPGNGNCAVSYRGEFSNQLLMGLAAVSLRF